MSNENTYRDCKCKPNERPLNASYVHNSSTPPHCCDNDKCECHHPLRLWAIKYEVVGVPKFSGVAVVQAKDLCNAQYVFIQNSKFNGFREYIHILCIEELYPNPEPILLLEDSAAIINRRDLKSYPFLLKSDYEHNIQNISDNVIEAVEDYIEHNPIQQVQSNWNETDETSKAYILNKPEIPDAQIQADWNETNESSKAFIQNKPTIPEAQVNADWNSESGKSQILNKPTDLVRKSDIEGLLKNDGTVYTGKYLEQVDDLDNFQASEGKIVQYTGATNAEYTNGYVYKRVGTRTIIPAGTEYIEINDQTNEFIKVGIENGRYYKVNDYEEIYWDVAYIDANYQWGIPIKRSDGYHVSTEIGIHVYIYDKIKRITNIQRLDANGYLINYYTKGTGRNSIIEFDDNTQVELDTYDQGSGTPIGSHVLSIYENINGVRIYKHDGYSGFLFTEYWGGEKRACYIGKFTKHNTEEETIIDTTEWKQWDTQPREDTSHYVTDTEIGWIEH